MNKNRIKPRNFHFLEASKAEMAKRLNQELPISIRNLDLLTERLAGRYDLISKEQLRVILKVAMISIRELLVQGAVLRFVEAIIGLRTIVFIHRRFGTSYPGIKFRTMTPVSLRKDPNAT
jgi:hypothetical protein